MSTRSIAALALLLAACGGDAPAPEPKADEKVEEKAPEPKVEEKAPEAAVNVVTDDGTVASVALEGNDEMKYNTNEIRVKVGRKVKLTLTHTGSMPKTAMGHNFVLLKPGTDLADFAGKASAAADSDYIPADAADSIVANTKTVGGGESVTIEFDAPAAGTYDFICSFPGHYAVMQGKFIVEE